MTTYRPRTSPAVIRLALAYADLTSVNQARHKFGLSHRSVTRWLRERDVQGPDWPTLDMDAEWLASRGRRSRKAARLRRYRTQRILNGDRPLLLDSTGTRRRVEALMRLGWPAHAIAARGGWGTPEAVRQLRMRARVTPRNAASAAAVYDALSMTVGPSAETRRRAELAGWPPPLAWNNIDDPADRPAGDALVEDLDDVDEAVVLRVLAGDRLPATRAERLEVIRRWDASGRSRNELARRTGWKLERYTLLQVAS